MASSAERQREYRRRQAEAGLVSVTVFVPAEVASDLRQIAELLCSDRDLEPGPLRAASSGRLVGWR